MSADLKRKTAEAQLSSLPLPTSDAGWAREIRARARTRLLEAGAPLRRDEYWRYTDPAPLTAPMGVAEDAASSDPAPSAFDGHARMIRFVNGRLTTDPGSLAGPGVAVQPISDALGQDITIAREIFGLMETAGQEKVDRPLAILNTATAQDGLVIQATGMPEPLHIRYDTAGEGTTILRHLVRVETGAEITLLESGAAGNTVWEIDVADGGTLHHVRLQDEGAAPGASHIFARVGAGSTFKTFTLTADGAVTRNEIVMDMAGDEGTGHIAGAILAGGQSHVDNTVFVTHTGVSCESRQVFKNVLAGRARGIFQGKIFVREGAQKTDGYQISQAVLLEDGAEFSAKPELEIYADDVACSHGSTTGSIDPTALFYLRSRGVRRPEAEAMLVAAFADEAVMEIDNPDLQDVIRDAIAQWMSRRG